MYGRNFDDEDSSNGGASDDAIEALQSLVDFHEGQWEGQARSFTVTPDVAAGILRRSASSPYKLAVKLGVDVSNKDFTMTETTTIDDADEGGGNSRIHSRTIRLGASNADVDVVDASYSLDATLPDVTSSIVGTDNLQQFYIEHCLTVNDDERMRGLVFYGADASLLRIVVCHEQRARESADSRGGDDESSKGGNKAILTPQDLIEMQGDVDRLVDKLTSRSADGDGVVDAGGSSPTDRLEQLQKAAAASSSSTSSRPSSSSTKGAPSLSLHPASLFELSSGVWLGDSVIRDIASVPVSGGKVGKGFGSSSSKSARTSSSSSPDGSFAQWTVGVQKVAWRWMWNFGDEIRQITEVGKSMGAALQAALAQSLGGTVAVNEGLSRRIPQNERMVYIDWDGDNAGFLFGSVYMQVRYERNLRVLNSSFFLCSHHALRCR